ncbi:MAG: hypothetical protein IKV21_04050, partial [Clostridia bacterium]|nr:hypothetical protein [Clostridia bacterium]
GGLSTPINMWAKAYYCPGKVNAGFDTYLDKVEFSEDNTQAEIEFTYYGENEKFCLLAVMNDGYDYICTVDGEEAEYKDDKGRITLTLKSEYKAKHKIIIKSK